MAQNVLFVRSEEDENSDPWDDTLLIRAYDSAFENFKRGLKKGPKREEESQPKAGPSRTWKEGDFCRARYSEDGVIYEAVIEKILSDACIVEYCGYGNVEHVALSDLRPSKGKAAREQQIQLAETTQVEWQECGGTSSETESSAVALKPIRRKKMKIRTGSTGEEIHMPSPPPPPPDFFSKSGKSPDSDQALHAMLMSWYMSGYHTGYYEALKSIKKK